MAEGWLSKLNGNPLEWMLESNPWTRYGTLTELMDYPRDDIEAEAALFAVNNFVTSHSSAVDCFGQGGVDMDKFL